MVKAETAIIDRMRRLGFASRVEPDPPTEGWYASFDDAGFAFTEPAGWIFDSTRYSAVRRAALMAFRRTRVAAC